MLRLYLHPPTTDMLTQYDPNIRLNQQHLSGAIMLQMFNRSERTVIPLTLWSPTFL